MSTIKVQWTASNEVIRKEYIETGECPKASREFKIDLTTLTPEQRKPIVLYFDHEYSLNVSVVYNVDTTEYHIKNTNGLDHSGTGKQKHDQQPAVEQVIAYCEDYLAKRAGAQVAVAEYKAQEQAEKERIAALEAEWQPKLDALIAAKDLNGLNTLHAPPELTRINNAKGAAYRELKQERNQADKEIWIKYHASKHLKRAFGTGYDCQREYVLQRAAQEAPDDCTSLQVDFNGTVNWQARCCPSSKALDIAAVMEKRFGNAKVVWLTEPPSSDIPDPNRDYYEDYAESFEPCEAVVSRNYLDKYDLIQIV